MRDVNVNGSVDVRVIVIIDDIIVMVVLIDIFVNVYFGIDVKVFKCVGGWFGDGGGGGLGVYDDIIIIVADDNVGAYLRYFL